MFVKLFFCPIEVLTVVVSTVMIVDILFTASNVEPVNQINPL